MTRPVFRFAPSPNGKLHLGHAYSALLNQKMATEAGGRLLLRMEDIDHLRCTRENCAAALADLRWLGITFEEPVLYQNERLPAYRTAIARLMDRGLLYVCTCTRKQLSAIKSTAHDPEGQSLYPGTCRSKARVFDRNACLRLDLAKATSLAQMRGGSITWLEKDERVAADARAWGDVVIARKQIGTSYHLSVVVDDAEQGVTDIVRGEDLLHATAIHRLLQVLLGLPVPRYHHHALIRHDTGCKLSKSKADTSLDGLRREGTTAQDIRRMLGFPGSEI